MFAWSCWSGCWMASSCSDLGTLNLIHTLPAPHICLVAVHFHGMLQCPAPALPATRPPLARTTPAMTLAATAAPTSTPPRLPATPTPPAWPSTSCPTMAFTAPRSLPRLSPATHACASTPRTPPPVRHGLIEGWGQQVCWITPPPVRHGLIEGWGQQVCWITPPPVRHGLIEGWGQQVCWIARRGWWQWRECFTSTRISHHTSPELNDYPAPAAAAITLQAAASAALCRSRRSSSCCPSSTPKTPEHAAVQAS